MSERSPFSRTWRNVFIACALLGVIGLTGYRAGLCSLNLTSACETDFATAMPAPGAVASFDSAAQSVEPTIAADEPATADFVFAPDQLWALIDTPSHAADWEARVSAATRQIDYVTINHDILHGKTARTWRTGQQLQLPLPEGDTVAVEITRTETLGPDRYIVEGVVPGVAETRFLMAVNQQHVAVSLDGLPQGELKIRTLGPPEALLNQLYTVDPDLEAICRTKDAYSHQHLASSTHTIEHALPSAERAEALTSGQAVVDVLIAYTSAARASIGSTDGMINQIDLTFAKVQSDYANSGITAILRLVGTTEVNLPGDESSSPQSDWQSDALDKITGTTDGVMDEIHALRDSLGADVVTLIQNRPDNSSAGIAWLMTGMDDYVASIFAFSVVEIGDLSDGETMSHELGHNFGCAHDRENSSGQGAFSHSYGYRVSAPLSGGGNGQIRTIMAYAPGNRVRYFSSPDVTVTQYTFSGRDFSFANPVPVGIAAGQSGEADNVSTMNKTAFQVANNRLSPNRSIAGKLVNVSTRAWVGSGFQTLIGGFVLNGTGTQRVLIRAPGPTIGAPPFNLTGALADTELTIDQAGVGTIATNDDWGTPAQNGIDVAAAAQQAGAFDFGNGSLDAGVVLDLAAGNYTALVIGKGGAQGYSLIEAYRVGDGSGAPRLLNLSTRGFASLDRPMVAGFVVNADPGAEDQRKSMFIRVRGPSLTNYGLPDDIVMSDPLIEIYNARSELVYVNDDWDAPSTNLGANRPTLQRGVVDQLSEQAVHDAAVAASGGVGNDMRPTEPGVVIELPAGIYTVFVKPFQSLPDQPEQPGVCIVEVFEITST